MAACPKRKLTWSTTRKVYFFLSKKLLSITCFHHKIPNNYNLLRYFQQNSWMSEDLKYTFTWCNGSAIDLYVKLLFWTTFHEKIIRIIFYCLIKVFFFPRYVYRWDQNLMMSHPIRIFNIHRQTAISIKKHWE